MSDLQHTLFLWPRGAFPRRIVYQLLQKGMVASPSALMAGETVVPNLKINIASLCFSDDSASMIDADPSDPKPQGRSSPSLRIKHPDGTERWICESTAIALYLEDVFVNFKRTFPQDPIDKAQAMDVVLATNLVCADFGYYIRHATPVTEFWSGLPNADRSHGAARNSRADFSKKMAHIQEWTEARWSTGTTECLTPGVEGPGIADFSLAAAARYVWLTFEFDVFEDDNLGGLRAWWSRFKSEVPWWDELEEVDGVHPAQLSYSKDIREI